MGRSCPQTWQVGVAVTEPLRDGMIGFLGRVVFEESKDVAGDVAFQAAHDLFLGHALGGSPFDVGAGDRVALHPVEHDGEQGVVGAAVAAPVEAMPVCWLFGYEGGVRVLV